MIIGRNKYGKQARVHRWYQDPQHKLRVISACGNAQTFREYLVSDGTLFCKHEQCQLGGISDGRSQKATR